MPTLVLVPPMSKSEIDKLSEEERAVILRYITPLHEAISDLLESDGYNFEYNFERTKTQFLMFSSLIVMTLKEDHFITLMRKHFKFSSQRRPPQTETPVIQALYNANDVIVDFLRLAFDTQYREFLPEYADALLPLLNLIIYCAVLMYVIENKSESRNLLRVVQECNDTAGVVEGWVDTIEIETDPEQRAILERVKQTPL